ncbi:unnamed protein product [Nippostrongylus brasiliensis]|uniref:Uncharacterized protein n=1 Tax=Nippostrongylus brasiliensis TaxID=27835 RepID=A0A0N4XWV4_NIPBR|nr:unnamed protein product [Nippostrongylus brasiliensis]
MQMKGCGGGDGEGGGRGGGGGWAETVSATQPVTVVLLIVVKSELLYSVLVVSYGIRRITKEDIYTDRAD